ncbi:hypothetical protein NHQ30_010321 [Ciborinia camelliae]|nr:hypothetical protein NHQ30_010321 [Ciborinia camelliae]
MTASSRGCSRAAQLRSSKVRSYATATSTFQPIEAAAPTHLPPSHSPSASPRSYKISTGIILSRPPLLTERGSAFEKAFYLYQKRLNERLVLPFTRYFYHKKDQPADTEWKAKVKERNGVAARDIGGYRAYGEEGWNDEVMIGGAEEKVGEWDEIAGKLVEEGMGDEGDQVVLEKRVGSEEVEGDRRSLARKLDETLYLLVKVGGKTTDREGNIIDVDVWEFPRGDLQGNEVLHTAAERILTQTAGPNMNTWIVGHVPIGSLTIERSAKFAREPEKVFFMKGRIMAGQVNLQGNEHRARDFVWLTKGEIEGLVSKRFWSQVGGMLGGR